MRSEHTPKCDVEVGIAFDQMVGRTIARLERGTTEGAYGDEPTVTLHFTDGTRHTLVLAADFAPGYDETPDLAVRRVGSGHEEDVIGGRAHCGVCGWIDEADPNNPVVRQWHGDSFEGDAFIVKDRPTEDTVMCKFCRKQVPARTAHRHDGGWVGDACGCWDQRLRGTE